MCFHKFFWQRFGPVLSLGGRNIIMTCTAVLFSGEHTQLIHNHFYQAPAWASGEGDVVHPAQALLVISGWLALLFLFSAFFSFSFLLFVSPLEMPLGNNSRHMKL